MAGGAGNGRGKPEGRGSWQTSVRRKDTLGTEKGAFALQSVPRCPFPQVKHRGPCGGFYFKFLLYFGHLLGCDSKLSKMQDKNSVAGAVERNVSESRGTLPLRFLFRVQFEKCPNSVPEHRLSG